jgi:ribosome biogenesis SPOUT family RNA methylase Rps3
MTTITLFEQQMKDGKPSGYKVEFSDGIKGYLVEKDSDKGLKVGDAVSYTSVTPEGKTYKKLTVRLLAQVGNAPVQSESAPVMQRPQINVGTGKSKNELKAEAAVRMAEVVVTGFFADKLDASQVEPKQKEYTKLLWSEIDEIFDAK